MGNNMNLRPFCSNRANARSVRQGLSLIFLLKTEQSRLISILLFYDMAFF